MENIFIISAVALFLYMTLWFLMSLILKRNDVADVAWGIGFILMAIISLVYQSSNLRLIIASLLVFIWGSRLAVHIALRNRGKKEDHRYKKWREDWGKWFLLRSFFQVYLLQGFLLYLIALPLLIMSSSQTEILSPLNMLGLVIWLVGFFFEAIGDWQLVNFIKNKDNRGKIIQTGLWRYTRHPNYFGEVTLWWGMFLLSLSSATIAYLGIISPLTITILILFVSGIPLLEKNFAGRADWEAYKKKTSAFFPLPPKN